MSPDLGSRTNDNVRKEVWGVGGPIEFRFEASPEWRALRCLENSAAFSSCHLQVRVLATADATGDRVGPEPFVTFPSDRTRFLPRWMSP
ncbi:hypothetical protein RSSM_04638 [Rhodopirellula sallentina SM41]|uniref:Uncharacterized protein n=1 Tax=Rhodopirellula sallentina SM41 TaxID=1263870 RepID=M5U7P3_9BACT|nr:hypothetical protein RSSM_04638 [Rhodopirellula sallentina SM41]